MHAQLQHYKRKPAGFTLLEMMLAVGLIALTATFVSINIGQSDSKLVLLEAKRFVALVNLAQDESILSGQPIKLTIDAETNQYSFSPLQETSMFEVKSSSADDEAPEVETEDEAKDKSNGDSFLRPRKIPEVVKLVFVLKPVEAKKNTASKFVPDRVHEILNENILDKAGSTFDDEPDENTILIEPNGIISPFSLSMSVEKQISKIELDPYGRAVIVEQKK